MKKFDRRIDKLEAAIGLTPKQKEERAMKEMMDYGQTLSLKTVSDLILFFREDGWHKKKGNQEARAELKERLKRYCEGKKVKIIDERRMPREGDAYLDELPFTTTQNPNAPDFDTLNERCLGLQTEKG